MTQRRSKPSWLLAVTLVAGGLALAAASAATATEPPLPPENDPRTGWKPTVESQKWPAPPPENFITAGTATPAPTVTPVTVDLRAVPSTPNPLVEGAPRRVHRQGLLDEFDPRARGPQSTPPTTRDGEPTLLLEDAADPTGGPGSEATPGTWVASFDARGDTGMFPPDTVLAVGPEYIVEAVNSGFVTYTKTGTAASGFTNFNSFVNLPSPWAGFTYDPRVVYSPEYGKFLMMIMGLDETNLKSYVWLMVSQDSNPNGNWWIYRFDVSTGSPGYELWLDYAAIGVDHWGVYFTGNYFPFDGSSGTGRTALWSWGHEIMSGGSTSGYIFGDVQWPSGTGAFAIQPAHPHTQNASGHTFFVATHSGSGNQICLFTLSGKRDQDDPNPDPIALNGTAVNCKQYYAMYNNVDQPGSGWDIDGGDARVMNAVYSNGRVYATWTLNWDGNRVYSEVYLISLTTAGAMDWERAVYNASYNFFYPAITIQDDDGSPDVFLSMSLTEPGSATGFASAASSTYDPTSGYGFFWVDNWGDAAYSRWDGDFVGDGRNRWGDYSGASWDWSCRNAWGAAEYASTGNDWDTQIMARTLGSYDPCQYFHVSYPNGGQNLTAGTTILGTWESMNIPSGDELFLYLWTGSSWHLLDGPLAGTTLSRSFTVPNIPTSGAQVWVGSRLSGDGDNWYAQDRSDTTFTITGLPDLANSSFSSPGILHQGESGIADNVVVNLGAVTSGSFSVEIRLSTNTTCSTSDTLLATRSSGSLGVGFTSGDETPITIPAGASTGSQYLCMMIDRTDAVDEFDETNNVATNPITIVESLFADGFESGNMTAWSSHS